MALVKQQLRRVEHRLFREGAREQVAAKDPADLRRAGREQLGQRLHVPLDIRPEQVVLIYLPEATGDRADRVVGQGRVGGDGRPGALLGRGIRASGAGGVGVPLARGGAVGVEVGLVGPAARCRR